MENLNAEAIKKAMECCQTPNADDCEKCEYRRRGNTDNFLIGCCNILVADALALINSQEQRIKELAVELDAMRGAANSYKMHNKKLTEENERLRADCVKGANALIEEIQKNRTIEADTVRKMQERLKEYIKVIRERRDMTMFPFTEAVLCAFEDKIDQIAKEMLEGVE